MRPIEKKYLPENFYLVLPVNKPDIPSRIRTEAEKYTLDEKAACHISVAVEKNAARIIEAVMNSDSSDILKQKVLDLFNGFDWTYELTDIYSLQEKKYTRESLDSAGLVKEPEHTRRSIIQIVELPDLLEFYHKLGELLKVEFPLPVPHITIFAWSDYAEKKNRGIGISSKEDFYACNKGII